MGSFVKVARVDEIPTGTGKSVIVDGRDIAVFNVDGVFHAIENDCKHRGGPLAEGELDGTIVTCPLHAWTYDVATGECFDDPACGVQKFAVKVEGDDLLLEI